MNIESDVLVLVLPLPPSVNDFYGCTAPVAHRVIKYVKTVGKEYKRLVAEYVTLNQFDVHSNIPLRVEIIFNYATAHRQDIDNRLKCLLDALTEAGVYEDDSLIYDLHVIRGVIGKPGGCVVRISEWVD